MLYAVACAVISERHSRAPRWSAGPMTCFTQLKLHLHWRGPQWSAGPLRCRTKACHSTRGLVSALTWFGSVLAAAVGGAPENASQGCLLALSVPCLRVCADVSDFLSWSVSREQLYRLCSSSEQGTNVSETISLSWSRRVSSFFYGSYGRFRKDVYRCQ